jgi:hypothetical protein
MTLTAKRIVRLSVRCAWYHNLQDRRLDLDLGQQALDAWEIPAIDAVEAEMDRRGLVWTKEIAERALPSFKEACLD